MKIDIDPIIEEAGELDKIALRLRDIDAFYLIRTFENKDYSVKFSKKELDEFQPNKTVSEMMDSWEANIDRRIKEIKKALHTDRHPYIKEMVESETEFTYRYNKRVPKMVIGEKNRLLEHGERESFLMSLERLNQDVGKLRFIKIV